MREDVVARAWSVFQDDGLPFVDADLVDLNPDINQDVIAVPATHSASEESGSRIVVNFVIPGPLSALTDVVSKEAMRQAVLDSVPEGTEELGENAFERGHQVGMALLEDGV